MTDREFERLIEPHRAELQAHCYRMLGSAHDAEDALQDALLRAWRGLPSFAERSSLRTWLHKIATNVCLRAIERRPKQVLPVDFGPAADPHDGPSQPLEEVAWVEPYPVGPEATYEQRESVELAFVAALQHLTGRQRAVLILREVLDFSAREVAEALGTRPTSVDSALQRARRAIEERLPERSQQAALHSLGDDRLRELVDEYVAAWERSDLDAVVALLADDVTLAMPPIPTWYEGRAAVAAFLDGGPLAASNRWRLVETRANGQLAFAHYLWDPDRETYEGHSITAIALDGERVANITAFLTPEPFERFGLAPELN